MSNNKETRMVIFFAVLGAFSGLALLFGSIYTGFVLPQILFDLKLLPHNETTYTVLIWLQVFGCLVGGTIWGVRLALKSLPANVSNFE